MDCPQHKIVSLTGNISPDGSAAFYNVIFTMADRIKARSFPMPLPVISSSAEERAMLLGQPMIQPTLELAAQADVTFVGIGDLGPKAPLYEDGFITEAELKALQKAGGVAEICPDGFSSANRYVVTVPHPARTNTAASASERVSQLLIATSPLQPSHRPSEPRGSLRVRPSSPRSPAAPAHRPAGARAPEC